MTARERRNLIKIWNNGGLSITKIAAFFSVHRSTISVVLASARAAGLEVRSVDPSTRSALAMKSRRERLGEEAFRASQGTFRAGRRPHCDDQSVDEVSRVGRVIHHVEACHV